MLEGDSEKIGKIPIPEIKLAIDPDENIYDQPPFGIVVDRISGTNPLLTVEDARESITLTARQLSSSSWSYVARTRGVEEMEFERSSSIGRDIKRRIGGVKFELPGDPRILVDRIIAELGKYPHLVEYIQVKVLEGARKNDGSTKKSSKGNIPEESYVPWVARRLHVTANQVLFGIEEVFRQPIHRDVLLDTVESVTDEMQDS